jgi:hypothetical protein
MEDLMEAFLTEQGVVIVDDDHVPSLRVTGSVESSGDAIEGSVRYHIGKLTLCSPEGKLFYSSSGKSAQGYGSRGVADEDARHLLKEYLGQDHHLMNRLRALNTYPYVQLSPHSLKKDITDIRRVILKMALDMEESPKLRARLKTLAQEQHVLKGQLAALAKQVKEGKGRISIQALLATQQQLLRALKTPYLLSGGCRAVEARDFSAVRAVLITIPNKGTQRIRSGSYAIYGENQRLIYEQTKDDPGPRVFSSLSLLKMSSLGRYFRSSEQYLKIEAIDYHPEDRAVILSQCDADAILHANAEGETPNAIFSQGRVVLIEGDTK